MELVLNEEQLAAVAAKVGAAMAAAGRGGDAPTMAPAAAEPWSEGPEQDGDDSALAPYIDHTLLKPTATPAQVVELCGEAREHGFASVCVNPSHVATAARELADAEVMVCTVIGFPLGATTSAAKAAEAAEAVAHGAEELDMVLAIGMLKAELYAAVLDDVRAVVGAAGGRTVKVIIETSMLTDEEKVAACLLSVAGGADFVKTSTGFGGGGATVDDIALMRRVVGPDLGVKASGGVRDAAGARALLAAGATRLGASASVAIVSGGRSSGAY